MILMQFCYDNWFFYAMFCETRWYEFRIGALKLSHKCLDIVITSIIIFMQVFVKPGDTVLS